MFQKIKVLIYFLFCGFYSLSQTNSLVVFSSVGQPFFLSVNHQAINQIAQSNIKVYDVKLGWNYIDIKLQAESKELTLHDSILIGNQSKFLNKEFTYALIENENRLQIIFKSISELSAPVKPFIPDAPVEVPPISDQSKFGVLYELSKNKPIFFNNYDTLTSNCSVNLLDNDIQNAIALLKKVNDEETKFRYLNEIIALNCYSALQLKQLIDLVPIDMDKLVLLKKGYNHLTDKENYTILLHSLQYPSLKQSFSNFVKERNNQLSKMNSKCTIPISDLVFEPLYVTINTATNEADKLVLAKKITSHQCLSSIQIKMLCQVFMHDREKLDIAKSGFQVLTDKQNAINLADEFQFKETKTDYLNFIKQQ
jgi:hypothetical protein